MAMSQSECMSKVIIPRVLVPCEESTRLVDRVLKQWTEELGQNQEPCNSFNKKEITARLDEVVTTTKCGTCDDAKDLVETEKGASITAKTECMLQLKLRNVIRVCVSASVFKEFASTLVVNTRTQDMGMMLMCIMKAPDKPFSALDAERWMKHDTLCHHTNFADDVHNPTEYTTFANVYGATGDAGAIESMLTDTFVTNKNKAQIPSDLKLAVHKDDSRRLLISGLEQFDLSSAIGRIRKILITEDKLDMLHTLVFNLVFQEETCTMHLFVSQLNTLNEDNTALCDLLLRHHVRSYVSRLNSTSMDIVPFDSDHNASQASDAVAYRECMLKLPITIPNPINIGANLCTYIVNKVSRLNKTGLRMRRTKKPY